MVLLLFLLLLLALVEGCLTCVCG